MKNIYHLFNIVVFKLEYYIEICIDIDRICIKQTYLCSKLNLHDMNKFQA